MICLDIDFFVFLILYSIVNLAFVFLSSNVCPFRFSNLSLTDDLLWYLFVTNRAALHHFYFIRVLLQIWVPDWASLLHRWSYKGDVSLFFDFTVGYIQISFQESNSFICFLTDICYMTFPLQVWCNCYAQAGFYKYDGRKLWLMINRFPDMDPYFTEINNVLLGSRGYEYDGFLLSKIYCFYFIKWQFMNFLYNFLFVLYFYSNKIWCIEKKP